MATTSDQVSPARLTDIILSLYLNAINSFPLTLSIYERKLSIQIKLLCILAVLMNPEGLDTAEVHEFVCVFCTLLQNPGFLRNQRQEGLYNAVPKRGT